MHYFNIRI